MLPPAVQNAVKESAFERNQEQTLTHAAGCHCLDVATSGVIANCVFDAVQIMKNVRCAQKLQQAKAGVAGEMKECDRVPTNGDLEDDDADLGERCVRQG